MNRSAILLVFAWILIGCKPADAPPPTEAAAPPTTTAQQTTQQAPAGGGTGIAPIGSGAAGGITPVTGSESVEGSGMGGLGQSAKDAARRAAAAPPATTQDTDSQ